MFKSYRNFTLDKPVNTKRLKVKHVAEGVMEWSCTVVQLHNTNVVHRMNVNNITTLNSGGWKTQSTKIVINTALKCIYGEKAPHLFQYKGKWYIDLDQSQKIEYFDGMIIGGGSGIPFSILNERA